MVEHPPAGQNRIDFAVNFVELRRQELSLHIATLVTNEDVQRGLLVIVDGRDKQGQITLVNRRSETINCEGLRHRIAYDANRLTVSLPSSCASDPRWIRAGLGHASTDPTEDSAFADDGYLDGRVRSDLALSSRIRRG